jgi:Ankyrin repeats (many copies)
MRKHGKRDSETRFDTPVTRMMLNMEHMDSGYDATHSIHDAAHAGDVDSIKHLLEEDVDRVREWGASRMQPLHFAASPAAAETLVSYGADIAARTDRQETPLHFAARNGHLDVVKVLLRYGADLHAVDNRGATPLFLAAHTPSPGGNDVAGFLLARGAELDLNSSLALGMLDRTRLLLDDPNAVRNAPQPETLVRLAVWRIDCAIREKVGPTKYERMRRQGAYELDPQVIASVVEENLEVLESLLANGAPMQMSYEALMFAVEFPHTAVSELLLRSGASVTHPFYSVRQGVISGIMARARRSACKDEMIALLRRYGCEEP